MEDSYRRPNVGGVRISGGSRSFGDAIRRIVGSQLPEAGYSSSGRDVRQHSRLGLQDDECVSDQVDQEVVQRFPTLERSRRSPFFPRREYHPSPYHSTQPSRSSRRTSSSTPSRSYTKEVVLLEISQNVVPRGRKRAILHDRKQVADLVEFNMRWSESEVIRKIEDAFRGILDLNQPPPRYVGVNVG